MFRVKNSGLRKISNIQFSIFDSLVKLHNSIFCGSLLIVSAFLPQQPQQNYKHHTKRMKLHLFQYFFNAILLCLLLSPGSEAYAKTTTTAWLIRFDIGTPEKIADHCQEAKTAEFDSLLVQVRGRADAFYTSSIAPRSEYLQETSPDFDPLAETLSSCAPIPVTAWLNVYYLWTGDTPPEDKNHPGHPDKDWIIHDADGRPVSEYTELERNLGWIEGTYADPSSEKYRTLMVDVVRELVRRYPVNGIHLDFVRYPGIPYGHNSKTATLFTHKWGFDPKWIPTDIPDLETWLNGSMPLSDRIMTTAALFWADLRAAQITAMVKALKRALEGTGRDLEFSAAIFPDAGAAFFEKGQDWQTWARKGLVDTLSPMAYFGSQGRVTAQLQDVIAFRDTNGLNVNLWAGLGAYIKDPWEISQEADSARIAGYNTFSLFSLGHLMRKKGRTGPYLAAMKYPLPVPDDAEDFDDKSSTFLRPHRRFSLSDKPLAPKAGNLARIAHKALGGRIPRSGKFNGIIQKRWSEFDAALPDLLGHIKTLTQEAHTIPDWVELDGIFRYVHPLDSKEKRNKQRQEIHEAREAILKGKSFARVARKHSQGGTRSQGGPIGRKYLSDDGTDRILARMKKGEISSVIEVINGYWLYKVKEKGSSSAPVPSDAIPWPARRVMLHKMLAQQANDWL